MSKLTEKELDAICTEAIKYCNSKYRGSDKVYKAACETYIAAVIAERERVKQKMIDAIGEAFTAGEQYGADQEMVLQSDGQIYPNKEQYIKKYITLNQYNNGK